MGESDELVALREALSKAQPWEIVKLLAELDRFDNYGQITYPVGGGLTDDTKLAAIAAIARS